MFKLLGAALIIASFTIGGFYIARSYNERPKQLRNLQQSLLMLETEIVYGSIPLHLAMKHIGNRLNSPIRSFYLAMEKNLTELDGVSAYECWEKAVRDNFHTTALKNQDKEILLQFGQTLGVSDREDQMKHIRLANQSLLLEENQAREDQKTYEKLSKNLGVLLGLLIVILMY